MNIPSSLFSTAIFWTSLKWLMILAVFVFFSWQSWRDDRKGKLLLGGTIDRHSFLALISALHRRNMQIWLLVSLLLVVVATDDIRYDANLLPQGFFSPPAVVTENKQIPSSKPAEVPHKSATELPFPNITEFNEINSKNEAYIDGLKERYESWMVTYYYLQQCKKTGADDYNLIEGQLKKELENAHAAPDVEANIMLAATGSYKEMYSGLPCDDAHIAQTKSMYDVNMQQIVNAKPQGAALKQVPGPKAETVH